MVVFVSFPGNGASALWMSPTVCTVHALLLVLSGVFLGRLT